MVNPGSNGGEAHTLSSGEIRWIAVDRRYLRRLRLISVAAMAAMLVFAAMELANVSLGAAGSLVPKLFLPLTVVVLAVAAQFAAVAALRRLTRRRLGVEGDELLFDPGNGNVERYPFDTVATGDLRQLLIGRRLIPLHGPLGPLFESDKLQSYIFARMTPASRVGTLPLLLEALKRGSRDLWIVLGVVCLAAGALLLLLVRV